MSSIGVLRSASVTRISSRRASSTPRRTAAPFPRFTGSLITRMSARPVAGALGERRGAVGGPVVDHDELGLLPRLEPTRSTAGRRAWTAVAAPRCRRGSRSRWKRLEADHPRRSETARRWRRAEDDGDDKPRVITDLLSGRAHRPRRGLFASRLGRLRGRRAFAGGHITSARRAAPSTGPRRAGGRANFPLTRTVPPRWFGFDASPTRKPSGPAHTRLINHSRLGDALLNVKDPPIRALFVPGQRPAAEFSGGTINMLCSDRYSDFGEGATYQSTRLDVR